MPGYNINLLLIRQQLKMIIIRMAVKADIIVVQDSLFQVRTVPDVDFIAVRVMAFPT